jgi:hypothetical protein
MRTLHFAIAPTALGAFGVAWADSVIARTWLHEQTVERTRARIRRRHPPRRDSSTDALTPTPARGR